jgi:hypothetical protein
MAITSDTATTVVVNGVSKTYDSWWISAMTINAADPNKAVKVNAVFRKCSRDETGVGTYSPVDKAATYQVDDLFALAATDPAIASLVDTLISTIGALAKTANKIS